MFAKKSLVAILVIALMVFVGYPTKASDDTEVIDSNWHEAGYPSADYDLMDNAYKSVADSWFAVTGLFGGIVGGGSDDFEDAPRMESPAPTLREPQPQVRYEYIPRHTTGYPKWVRRPAE